MNPGRLPWAGMNDAFGVSTVSAERPQICIEEFCPAPELLQAFTRLLLPARFIGSLAGVIRMKLELGPCLCRAMLAGGLSAGLLFTGLTSSAESLPRLKVSENRHFLVTDEGEPFFWLGDTAWELFHRLSRENAFAECARPRAQQAPNDPTRLIPLHPGYFLSLLRPRTGALRKPRSRCH
jgi:hypothetical protein